MDGTAGDMGGIDAWAGMPAEAHRGRAGFATPVDCSRGLRSIWKSARDNLPRPMTSFHARGMATPAWGRIGQVGPYVRAAHGCYPWS